MTGVIKMKHKEWFAVILLMVSIVFVIRLIVVDSSIVVLDDEVWVVYFASDQDIILVPDYRVGNNTINDRLQALVKGPLKSGMSPIFPPGTKVINYQLEGNILYVNFNQALVINHPGGSATELITVYGLVNTMTEKAEIDYVQILVEGRILSTIAGHVDISIPLSRDGSLISTI